MAAASALVQISMATVVTNRNDNGGYKALMTDTQQLNGPYKQMQYDKKRQQQQQQQQQQIQQLHFEPFDFANLRRLQLKYKNAQSYGNQGQQEQLQQQQQHRQQISHYSENKEAARDQDNEDGNGNSNKDYASYYSYSLGNEPNDNINQNNNNNNNNNNKPNSNGNPNRDVVDDNDYEQHQDARNSFRLQSSDSNEPYRSRNNKNDNGNNNNNSNNNNDNVDNSNNNGNSKSPLSFGEMEFYDDLETNLPYGIQNVKRVPRRNTEHAGKVTTYQSLCPTKRVSIPLETNAYEYRPNHYIEVNCAHSYSPTHSMTDYNKNRICSEAGFACIQLNRTIHLIRRSKESAIDCWESEIRIVPSGCECMWPKHHFGDIITYHQEQKRQNIPPQTAPTRLGELGHVESGDYLEIPVEMVVDLNGQERVKDKIVDIYERT